MVATISTCTRLQTSSSTASLYSRLVFPSSIFSILTVEVSISFYFLNLSLSFCILIPFGSLAIPHTISKYMYMGFNFVVGFVDYFFKRTRVYRILNLGFSELRRMMVLEQLPSLIVRMNLFSLLIFPVL